MKLTDGNEYIITVGGYPAHPHEKALVSTLGPWTVDASLNNPLENQYPIVSGFCMPTCFYNDYVGKLQCLFMHSVNYRCNAIHEFDDSSPTKWTVAEYIDDRDLRYGYQTPVVAFHKQIQICC